MAVLVSTKGRYALRVMIDLAENSKQGFIPLKEIAQRQEVSEKYLENIIGLLSKTGLLEGVRGKGGGYRLTKPPEHYTVRDILKATEGTLAPVACLKELPNRCRIASDCKTLPVWEQLHKIIDDYLESVTLSDIAFPEAAGGNYVI